MGEDNVISLPVGDARREHNQRESEIAELPIGRAPYKLDACEHAHSVVDSRARTLTCASCGVALDPIERLDHIAGKFAAPLKAAQNAARRTRELQEGIRRLEREERNAKARVRTARKRALVFDAAAVDAALVERYAANRWGAKDFMGMSPDEQERARQSIVPLIEAYIGVLTAG